MMKGDRKNEGRGWTWERRDQPRGWDCACFSLSFLRHPQCLPPNSGQGCKPILSGRRIESRRPAGKEDNNKRAYIIAPKCTLTSRPGWLAGWRVACRKCKHNAREKRESEEALVRKWSTESTEARAYTYALILRIFLTLLPTTSHTHAESPLQVVIQQSVQRIFRFVAEQFRSVFLIFLIFVCCVYLEGSWTTRRRIPRWPGNNTVPALRTATRRNGVVSWNV